MPGNTTPGVLQECTGLAIVYHLVHHGEVWHRPPLAGCATRRERLLFLKPFPVTRGYTPGPHVAMFVPVTLPSSENSPMPDTIISEEMLLFH